MLVFLEAGGVKACFALGLEENVKMKSISAMFRGLAAAPRLKV